MTNTADLRQRAPSNTQFADMLSGLAARILLAMALLFSLITNATAHGSTVASQSVQTFRDCPYCPEMVVVPPGHFLMGSSPAETSRDAQSLPWYASSSVPWYGSSLPNSFFASEHPAHSVNVERFALGKYPVTRGEYAAFMRETNHASTGGCIFYENHKYPTVPDGTWERPGFEQKDRDPVVCVSWEDAKAYIDWLNGKLGGQARGSYRLPSEAEWEYAARAGTRTARWWGDAIGRGHADCGDCGSPWDNKRTAPVDSFPGNPFGLHEMLGNVFQWTEDCWHNNYLSAPADSRAWTADVCQKHVLRGSNWGNDAWVVRSADRTRNDKRTNYIGFRVARTLQQS